MRPWNERYEVRIYVSTLSLEIEGRSGARVEVLRLLDLLAQNGHQADLGLGYEDREEWYALISGYDAMLVALDPHWWSSAAKCQQVSDAIRYGITVYFFTLEPCQSPVGRFGPEAQVLDSPLESIAGQLNAGLPERRLQLASQSLRGVAVGDAFGETFFGPKEQALERIGRRVLRDGPWCWTDDTAQTRCVLSCLSLRGRIEPDTLANLLVEEYRRDPARGYGANMHTVLTEIGRGVPWSRASRASFDGAGSYGNGGAMRATPVGAYFFDNPGRVTQQARLSAQATHSHPEGQAGAEAVALSAAWAASGRGGGREMIAWVHELTQEGRTRSGLEQALAVPASAGPEKAAEVLGSGQQVAAWDTVPFVVWCAAHYHHSYREALWATVAGLGDRDTTCAMVGGIVVLSCTDGIPTEWLEASEPT